MVGLAVLAILTVLVIALIAGRTVTKVRYQVKGENSIYEMAYPEINGQKQYLLIKGENAENPVILWLHGGPGSPDSFVDYCFIRPLADEYTVVAWDQRGCGETYFRNAGLDPMNETVSFAQALEDVDAVVDYLRDRFGKEKIVIVGHSYGTILGTNYVAQHPEKVECYVGVGTAAGAVKGYLAACEDAVRIASARGEDTSRLREAYENCLKDRSLDNVMKLKQLSDPYHKGAKDKSGNAAVIGLLSPDLRLSHIRWLLKTTDLKGFFDLNRGLMGPVLMDDDMLADAGPGFSVPMGFVNGSADWTTPAFLVEEYYEKITAPEKDLVIMEECGHSPQTDDPEGFVQILKTMLDSIRS